MLPHLTLFIVECLLVALGAGLVYGIFGGGSGLIMTPGFYYIVQHFSLAQTQSMQMAIATTATASAILGVFSSAVQWRLKHIDFSLVKCIVPGLFLGTLLAITLLNIIPSAFLKRLFSIVVILVAVWLWKYQQENDAQYWPLYSLRHHVMTFFIGVFWFLFGVAVFTVPYLHKCGVDLRRSVGSATLISTLFSAIAGILLMITGIFHIGLSKSHVGYVNLWILICVAIPSTLSAYLGSKISVLLSKQYLKKIYALLIFTMGVLMLV